SSRRDAGGPTRSDQWSWSLRVELDDELFLGVDRDGLARGTLDHAAGGLVRVDGEPRHRLPARGGFLGQLDGDELTAGGRHPDLLARGDPVGGDVDPVAVDLDVAVRDELARGLAAGGEAHPVHHVV